MRRLLRDSDENRVGLLRQVDSRILSFRSLRELCHAATEQGIAVSDDLGDLHELDTVRVWLQRPDRVRCAVLFEARNDFLDVADSVDDRAFQHLHYYKRSTRKI